MQKHNRHPDIPIMYLHNTFNLLSDASLEWETIEQYFLWQLISAHNIPPEHIMPILPKLEYPRKWTTYLITGLPIQKMETTVK